MPKITLQPDGAGVRQARGAGVHFLSQVSGKGFVKHVKHASVSSGVAADSAVNLDCLSLPANAVLERIAFKFTTLYGNADGNTTTDGALFTGFTFAGQAVVWDLTENGGAGGFELHPDGSGTQTAGAIVSVAAADLPLHANKDAAGCAPSFASGSGSDLTLQMTLAAGGVSGDTQAVIEVLVEYSVPTF